MRRCFIFFLCLLNVQAFCQKNWKAMDYQKDGVYGISLAEAEVMLKTLKPDTVTVAVLDDGVDVKHSALKKVIWINSLEQGHDEDKNGFVNDRFGWNFLGSGEGRNLINASYEYQRLYYLNKEGSGNLPKLSENQWVSIADLVGKDSLDRIYLIDRSYILIKKSDSVVQSIAGKDIYTLDDLINYKTDVNTQIHVNRIKSYFDGHAGAGWTNKKLLTYLKSDSDSLRALPLRNPFAERQKLVGDDPIRLNDVVYGNPSVSCLSVHGTHVAGIIGAMAVDAPGICPTVKIMPVRTVPNGGDEFDKDVALAIRYAVDNGAKVINMSFGKRYSAQPGWVEDAIRYAEKKDVLIIKAAGNDGIDTDSISFYPKVRNLKTKKGFKNVIVVGASGPNREKLIASFSNYGRNTVDVFAPGVEIYSTLPDNQYGKFSGTSMAAPVVTGLAAIIRSNFPHLKAKQVKWIIMNSVEKIDFPVTKPGDSMARNRMSDLCVSGGIVNANRALALAKTMAGKK